MRSIRYVGVADPDTVIPAGPVVRLSLSHPLRPPDGPGGYLAPAVWLISDLSFRQMRPFRRFGACDLKLKAP